MSDDQRSTASMASVRCGKPPKREPIRVPRRLHKWWVGTPTDELRKSRDELARLVEQMDEEIAYRESDG